MKIYENFAHAEASIRVKAPRILYKYRDWSNLQHRKLLTHQQVWLSSPANLNDPLDVRIPLRFLPEEIDHPVFFGKLQKMMAQRSPHLDPASREFRTLCENHLDLIKINPAKWFTDTWERIRVSDLYECYGVLSLTDHPLTKKMWDEYGGSDNCGFCVGWEVVELARSLDDIGLGKVWYQDETMVHSFVTDDIESDILKQYIKRKKYSFEAEWRFITPQIEHDSQRTRVFDSIAVREVILDDRMPTSDRNAIIVVLREAYGSRPALYQLLRSPFGLDRISLAY
jgi:hypothetical protein